MPRSPDLLRPSACVAQPAPPPPIGVLLKTKAKVQFDRTVTERSKLFFGRFTLSNRCHFAGLFTLVTLCRCIDRQWVATFQKLRGANPGPPTSPVLAWRGGIPPRFQLSSSLPMAEGRSPERSRRGPVKPGAERSKTRVPMLANC